jgi:hypothetical protein
MAHGLKAPRAGVGAKLREEAAFGQSVTSAARVLDFLYVSSSPLIARLSLGGVSEIAVNAAPAFVDGAKPVPAHGLAP